MTEEWTYADSQAARSEGWDLFDVEGEMRIKRIGTRELQPSYSAGWEVVAKRANAGSVLHGKALRMVSAEYRQHILDYLKHEGAPVHLGSMFKMFLVSIMDSIRDCWRK